MPGVVIVGLLWLGVGVPIVISHRRERRHADLISVQRHLDAVSLVRADRQRPQATPGRRRRQRQRAIPAGLHAGGAALAVIGTMTSVRAADVGGVVALNLGNLYLIALVRRARRRRDRRSSQVDDHTLRHWPEDLDPVSG